ncbi:hypothetical protein N8663_01720 [Verrucomicrobia bacterium]|nr:hypothetical protein [Verrucomicrobiota bacterium]MDA7672229.1 hypothetical protein [Verrucomicrobiota bacterium]
MELFSELLQSRLNSMASLVTGIAGRRSTQDTENARLARYVRDGCHLQLKKSLTLEYGYDCPS